MNFELVYKSVTKENLFTNHDFGKLTTFKAGGKAKYFCEPNSLDAISTAVSLAKRFNVDYRMLGGGSNILVSDSGFDGLVISTKRLDNVCLQKEYFYADCGVSVAKLIAFLKDNDIGGYEFLVGIPATVGGLIATNAGAFNQNIGQKVKSIFCYQNGILINKAVDDGKVFYRNSLLDNGQIALGVLFKIEQKGFNSDAILRYTNCRKNQPKGNSCGCVFKNPDSDYAGRLIDKCGLKGYKINGASISNSHANFIINDGTATASDIYALIKKAKQKVYQNFNVLLEEEVHLIGDF